MESLISSPMLVVSAIVILVCVYVAALPRPISGIPYNKSSAWNPLGDALDFLAWARREGNMSGFMPVRIRQLKSPIVQVFVQPFKQPWVLVADATEAHDILTRRIKQFDRSQFFGQVFEPVLPHNHLHLSTGPEWSAHRQLIRDTMSASFLNGVVGPLFWTTSQDLIKLWKIKLQLARGRPFSVLRDIHDTALEVVWHGTLGSSPGSMKRQLKRLSELSPTERLTVSSGSIDSVIEFPRASNSAAYDSIAHLTDSLEIPINSMLPNIHYRLALNLSPALRESVKHKDALLKQSMAEAKDRVMNLADDAGGSENYTSAIDLVMHREKVMAEKQGRLPDYDSKIIADELFGFLFAGHETTSTTLCWGIKLLAANPMVQSKLRTSLRAAFTDAYSSGDQPSFKDISSEDIPYLDAVMAEIHRKAMTVAAVSRVALVDTTVLGYHIPKGTNIFLLNNGPGFQTPAMPAIPNIALQGREKQIEWNQSNIEEFMPERWLKRASDGVERFDDKAGPSQPFGGGPRACFGRKWAQLEFKVILTLIIWNFELQSVPPAFATFKAVDKSTYSPQQCYVRLAEAR